MQAPKTRKPPSKTQAAKPAKPGAEQFYWSDVYGLTCDEVWVYATNTADSGFYRIRLDSPRCAYPGRALTRLHSAVETA